MCIGLPMQVTRLEPGYAWVRGRGEERRVNTALVGPCQPGDWLLIFLDGAREHISAERAAEIDATLDVLGDAMLSLMHPQAQTADSPAPAGFELPSAMSAEQLAALTGAALPNTPHPPREETA
jgi:hydrogenase expression/formation protein HypC